MKSKPLLRAIFLLAILCVQIVYQHPTLAQTGEAGRPIDMVIVLDNSCSMFPKEMLVAGCTSYGSDIDFLRIIGADLFLARLGFDQEDEADYQVSIISLGDEPTLISPLGPLMGKRDELASLIANPAPEKATRFVPALQLAYRELYEAPNRKEGNLPAVVLITDGVPYPPEGQSNADIEKLIQEHPDIPVFLMILKGSDSNLEEFDEYVKFWQGMQQTYDHVFVYVIEEADQIQDTYNTIIALLQDTIPTKGNLVTPGNELPFYVSQYIDKVVLTVSYPPGASHGSVQVIDPRGQVVRDGEPGVAHFRGEQNPVEIISISAPRLADEYKDQFWQVESDTVVNVFIDRVGAYRIKIITPDVTPSGLKNVYYVEESQTPRQEFVVRFSLVSHDGGLVLDPQPIWAELQLPDGTQTQIPSTSDVGPDEYGVYALRFDLPAIYPYVSSKYGRFAFIIHAGSASGQDTDMVPIATARLLVDVGPSPFIQMLNPAKILCSQEGAQKVQLSIGDYQSVVSGTLKAVVSSSAGEVVMLGQGGDLRGDLSPLCQALLSGMSCGQQAQVEFAVKIDARLPEGHPFQAIERSLPVEVGAPACTPSPTQTAAAFILPTPRPTPVPDTDQDGYTDLLDSCPVQPGRKLFGGCPAPVWFWLVGGAMLVLIGVMLVAFVWPWFSVRYISQPADVYLLICIQDSPTPAIVSLQEVGIKHRTARIKIGGDRKLASLYIPGLKPVEFIVEERGDKVVLLDASKGDVKAVFRQLSAEKVNTSNPGICLWVASKRSAVENVSC